MKKIIIGCLVLGSSTLFAAGTTDLNVNWRCTTNASSSDVATDKAADDLMANGKDGAVKSFEFAAKNCRDCTKITCEVKD